MKNYKQTLEYVKKIQGAGTIMVDKEKKIIYLQDANGNYSNYMYR